FGTKLPWPRLNDVAVPALAVDEHPEGARDTRNRSIPGGSKARMVVVVVAEPIVGGSARLGESLPSAFMKAGVVGRTTLFGVKDEPKPQVLQAVTEDELEPPATNAKAPSGANDTSVAGAVRGIVFNDSCADQTYKLEPATMKAFRLSG